MRSGSSSTGASSGARWPRSTPSELAGQLPHRAAPRPALTITAVPEDRGPDRGQCGGPIEANPLRSLELRTTYRTLRVLKAIAEQPQSSNRQVALDAGVSDRGQMGRSGLVPLMRG